MARSLDLMQVIRDGFLQGATNEWFSARFDEMVDLQDARAAGYHTGLRDAPKG